MSIAASPPELAQPRAALAWVTRTIRRVRSWPLPLQAFLGSRIVVVASGVIGTLVVRAHVSTGALSNATHQLGSVGYVLAGPTLRFDSGYYLGVAAHGYRSAASAAFFPLYPLLVRCLTPLFVSAVIAGAFISLASFAGALYLLHRLTELELGRRSADAAVLLISFAPLSFFFSAVYTESLFLLLSVGAVLAARQDRWRLACLLGVLVTLTRPNGILIILLLAGIRIRRDGGLTRELVWLLALPGALLIDLAILHASGFSWLAPFHAQSLWHRHTTGPVAGLAAAGWQALKGVGTIAQGGTIYHPTLYGPFSAPVENLVLFSNLALAVLALTWCRRRLPIEYALYVAALLLVVASSPVTGEPLMSVDRFILTAFPLFMAAGEWASRRRLVVPLTLLGGLLLVFYTVQVSSWAFVS